MHETSVDTAPSGTLYIIAAPSGAGKTSLVKALVERSAGVRVSVSHTTRAPRPGERDGVDYHFVDAATFQAMIKDGAFLEHASVFGHYYGTSRSSTLDRVRRGSDVILEIDWQGARQVRAALPHAVGVFILPPSRAVLEQRLRGRAQDSEAVIRRRLHEAREELAHFDEFDYLVVNDDFDTALAELQSIVVARRLRRAAQQPRLQDRLADLLAPAPAPE